jgi:hypothetical protein
MVFATAEAVARTVSAAQLLGEVADGDVPWWPVPT